VLIIVYTYVSIEMMVHDGEKMRRSAIKIIRNDLSFLDVDCSVVECEWVKSSWYVQKKFYSRSRYFFLLKNNSEKFHSNDMNNKNYSTTFSGFLKVFLTQKWMSQSVIITINVNNRLKCLIQNNNISCHQLNDSKNERERN
jgi:hypothetical protein